MLDWLKASLSRKLLFAVAIVMAVASLLFLALFVGLYRDRLEQERSEVSAQVNRLLQVSLENAMLKRDIPGLRGIVDRLAQEPRIRNVMILHPGGEVRFSADKSMLGRMLDKSASPTCTGCHQADGTVGEALTAFMTNEFGEEVLRSVNPVRNKPQCKECHGAAEENPVNGILFVDYEAAGLRKQAFFSAMALSVSGALVAFVTFFFGGWVIRRMVLAPIGRLATASNALAEGRLDTRVAVGGEDELGRLADAFNRMAGNVQGSLAAVAEHERFLQEMIDRLPDGIRVIDQDYRIVVANNRYCELVGQSMADVVGTPCHRSSHGRPTPCPPTLLTCPLEEIRATGERLKCTDRFTCCESREIYVEVTAAPLTLARDGRPVPAIIESIRDLSQEMLISHGQKLSELGQLATGIAHEVHNPLASSRVSLQTILRLAEQGAPDMEEICDYLKILDREIDKCVEVTGRLLRLSMPPAKYPQLVELPRAIGDVISLLAYEAEDDGIGIVTEYGPEPLRVLITESELRMVILNLVQNAFHAMPEGGRMTLRTRRADERVLIEIADTGVGIRPDQMARIFDPFYSLRADHKTGTGLGLPICKAIMERYKGQITVTSEVGKGSTFVVDLPDPEQAEGMQE